MLLDWRSHSVHSRHVGVGWGKTFCGTTRDAIERLHASPRAPSRAYVHDWRKLLICYLPM